MAIERHLLRDAIGRERVGDLDGSTTLYQRLLLEFPTWALDKKVETRLLAMWRKAVDMNVGLVEAAKMVQQQIYVQANDARIKCLALSSLGDIERYGNRISQAGLLYQQAIEVCPSMGKAFNQLAVVQSLNDSSCSQLMAIHGYLRALWAERSFGPAQSNLLHAFAVNRLALSQPQATPSDRFNRLIIRLAELAFQDEDDDPGPLLAQLEHTSRLLALSQQIRSLPNLVYILIIFLGLASKSLIAWNALTIVFGWQMTSLAISTAPRTDLILAIFCICSCRRVKDLIGNRMLVHLSRLANTLVLDGIDHGLDSPKSGSVDATSLDLFVEFAPVESIPGWSSVVDGLYHSPDFMSQSVKTLATLVMSFDATVNRFDVPDQGPAPLVVLDVPNLCMKHGKDRVFSCKGLALVVHFFMSRGLSVRAFVPEQCIDYEKVANLKRLGRLEGWASKASAMPDDIALLRVHYASGIVATTPHGDYDDSYTIEHARRNNGVIVSNDRFRDAPQKRTDAFEARLLSGWIRSNVCSFTFAGDQFIPNPDFIWPPAHEPLVNLSQ